MTFSKLTAETLTARGPSKIENASPAIVSKSDKPGQGAEAATFQDGA